MRLNHKISSFIYAFLVVVHILILKEGKLFAQWQFNQDFKVSDNYVGIGMSLAPKVALCNSGSGVIVWIENYTELYYQLMDENNAHVGISMSITSSIIPGENAFDVAVNEIGDFSVVWANLQTSDIYLKRFESDGTPSGSEIKVNENEVYNDSPFPINFAMNGSGSSVVVWENNKDGYKNIYGQYYNSDGTPNGNNFQVTDDPLSAENYPTVSMDSQGNFVVVWIDSSNGESKLCARRYDNGCNSLGSQILIDEWQEFSYSNFLTVKMNDQGYFLIGWKKEDQQGQWKFYGLLFDPQGNATGIEYQLDDVVHYDNIDAVLFNDNSSILTWGATRYQRFANDGSQIGGTATADIETRAVNAPAIAGNNSKDFIFVWYGKPNSIYAYNIYAQRYFNDGQRNGPNVLVSREIVNNVEQYRPAISCNSPGKFVIAWNDKRNKNYYPDVYAQILESNGDFMRDNFYIIFKQYIEDNPDVSMKDNGSFIVLWQDDNSCEPVEELDLYAKWYNPNGIPSEQFKVNDVDCIVWMYKPKVEIAQSGDFVIVWTDQRTYVKKGKIYCQMYDANSNPIGVNFEVNDPVDKLAMCQKPSLGIDTGNNFVVVWEADLDNDWDNWDVYGKIFNSDGIAYQSNFMINDDGGLSNQNTPAMDMFSDGSFIVTWTDEREGNKDIFAQHYDTNWNPVGNNFMVNDGGLTSAQSNPTIAYTPDGKFVIAWQDARNGHDDIFAQKFDVDGSKIGGNYRVSDDDGAATQSYPQVDCNSDNVYFTWQDTRVPNEDYDIFARVEPFSGIQHWIEIKNPGQGQKWYINQPGKISWSSSNLGGTVAIEISLDNGASWKTLTTSTPFNADYIEYTPTSSDISDDCLIKITSNDHPEISDISNRFNIFKLAENYIAKQFSMSIDPITIDGILDEPIWSDVAVESLLFGGEPEDWIAAWNNFTNNLVTWKAIWSPENNKIYVAIEVIDNKCGTLDNNDPNESPFYPFNDDAIELYVDGDHSGGLYEGSYESAQQWLVTTENMQILNYYDADKFGVYSGNAMQTAVTLGSNGNWFIEVELIIYNTFESEQRSLVAGDTIGWDIWYDDSDDETVGNNKFIRDYQTGWYYTEQAYKNADCFRNLILSDIVVPVELASFEASFNGDAVQLTWQTTAESNNYGFEVQRSENKIHFEKIGFVPGSGTTTVSHIYHFNDRDVSHSIYYYRLKQLDYSGEFCYSSAIQVKLNIPRVYRLYPNYPNPFNAETCIRFQVPEVQRVKLNIYNVHGQEIMTLMNKVYEPGTYSVIWDATDAPSGFFICKMNAGSFSKSLKLMVLK